MNSIDQLKQEIKNQKEAIEERGGTVNVANLNASPAEITAGIKTMQHWDLSDATATESDVLKGKTFYALNNATRTGTLEAMDLETIHLLFANTVTPAEGTTPLEYYIPAGTTKVKDYFMGHTVTYINVYLNPEVTEIGKGAFQESSSICIYNLNGHQNITKVGDHGLSNVRGIDLSNLPPNLASAGQQAFSETVYNNKIIKLPSSLAYIGPYCFGSYNAAFRAVVNSVDINDLPVSPTSTFLFAGVSINGNWSSPSYMTNIPGAIFWRGGPKTFYIGENVTLVGAQIAGFPPEEPLENKYFNTAVFYCETPPIFYNNTFGTIASLPEDFKVYVPDQSIEAYKAKSYIKQYANYMHPLSEMP